MQVIPVDVVEIIAVVMGISIVPVIGITARFAREPTVEALGPFFEELERAREGSADSPEPPAGPGA